MTDPEVPSTDRPQTSTRDHDELAERLSRWLGARPGATHGLVTNVAAPSTNGMSSETLLFDAEWVDADGEHHERCVARLEPEADAVPVFPSYDLELQYRVMNLVGDRSAVPVPRTLWFEPGREAVGSPFIVMRRVDGVVPPDVMPYPFGDNWLFDADPADQDRLQERSVQVLADLHAIEATDDELSFLDTKASGDTPLRRHVNGQRAFYDWARGALGPSGPPERETQGPSGPPERETQGPSGPPERGGRPAGEIRIPVIEATFAWLDENWPDDEGPTVISWGDGRIGNIIYRDFEPVAALDWEMAALGPRELDLAWTIFIHRFFQDLAEQYGMPGMPNYLHRDDVAATYESMSGHTPRDLDWYLMYAALRHGIVMTRTAQRGVHFGERDAPEDPDDYVMHRVTIERMLAGTYWDGI